jgi:hypothetical protein
MPTDNSPNRLATALAWLRDCLLAIDLIVVVSILVRLLLSGPVGLAEWVYHMNRIDSLEQAPEAMGIFVAMLTALLACTVVLVFAAGLKQPPQGTRRRIGGGLFGKAAAG